MKGGLGRIFELLIFRGILGPIAHFRATVIDRPCIPLRIPCRRIIHTLSGSWDYNVCVWSVETGEVPVIAGRIHDFCWIVVGSIFDLEVVRAHP